MGEDGKSISNSFCSRLHQQPAKCAGRAQTKVKLYFATDTNTDENIDTNTNENTDENVTEAHKPKLDYILLLIQIQIQIQMKIQMKTQMQICSTSTNHLADVIPHSLFGSDIW